MYHERGIRQADIADSLHLSQARVSRLLKRAAETGIVRTVVVVSQGVHTDLEEALEQKYGLLEAVVVDVDGDDQDIITGLGSAGATYLESTLTGGDRIGISSWSQTILAAVDRMRPSGRGGGRHGDPVARGFGAPSAQAQANRLLGELAEIIGAKPTFLPAPGLVGSPNIRKNLLADPAIAEVAGGWKTLTMALLGIGSLPPSPLLQASGNAVSRRTRARSSPPARSGTSVCASSIAGDPSAARSTAGSSASTPRPCAPSPAGSAWPAGASKHQAIRAAIKGGWVNVILTDLGTARALLEPEGELVSGLTATWKLVESSAVESPPTQTSKFDASITQSRSAAFQ